MRERLQEVSLFLALRSIILLLFSGTTVSENYRIFSKIHEDINAAYDLKYPLTLNLSLSELKSHHHHKRCVLILPHKAIGSFLSKEWSLFSQGNSILVNSPCLGSDSFGNYLGLYFENIMCAGMSRVHYISVGKVYEPKTKHLSSAFVSHLPDFIENPNPADFATSKILMQQYCRCDNLCHEQKDAAWVSGIDIIKPLFKNALSYHLKSHSRYNETKVDMYDISTEPDGTILPLIPDVAIHYRCGDNFVGYYGFLPFSVFKEKIPHGSKTIYVLADKRGRKTGNNSLLASKCDAILSSLIKFLIKHFPDSKILLKRGDDLYKDLARLSFAKTTFCSASTFCLWPAIANSNRIYFPRTKLIVGGDTEISLGLGFVWISDPEILLGADLRGMSAEQIIEKLGGKE